MSPSAPFSILAEVEQRGDGHRAVRAERRDGGLGAASLSLPCSWPRAGARIQARAGGLPAVTLRIQTGDEEFLHHASTLWASRSRSKARACAAGGAASRSGGRGGRPSPGLGVGRLSNSGCGACGTPGGGSGGGAAAAARGLPSIEPLRGRFFLALFLPVAAATAALASFFADLTREFARRRVGLIGFFGFASLGAAPPGVPLLPACSGFFGGGAPPGAAPPGVPLAPACSIPGWWQRRAPTGQAARGLDDDGANLSFRRACRASSRRAGPRRCGGTRSWPEHGG